MKLVEITIFVQGILAYFFFWMAVGPHMVETNHVKFDNEISMGQAIDMQFDTRTDRIPGAPKNRRWKNIHSRLAGHSTTDQRLYDLSETERDQILCLAMNAYHESRSSSLEDQIAVSHVVLNRMEADYWGANACSVVWQTAQFSWTLNGDVYPHESIEWSRAQVVAQLVWDEHVKDRTGSANHYHATYVKPRWARNQQATLIGAHQFMEITP